MKKKKVPFCPIRGNVVASIAQAWCRWNVTCYTSGGGHRRQSKTEVSYDFVAMKTFFCTALCECGYG